MDTGQSRSYYDDPNAARPLLSSEPEPREKVFNIVNLAVGGVTAILVIVTLFSAFFFPHLPPSGLNVFFAICIVMILVSHLVIIFWYRQGGLDNKFKILIYYNTFTIVMLCLCANLYIHIVKK